MNYDEFVKLITSNGVIDVGLSAGVDKTLPAVDRIRFFEKNNDASMRYMLANVPDCAKSSRIWKPIVSAAIIFIYQNDLMTDSKDDSLKLDSSLVAGVMKSKIEGERPTDEHVNIAASVIFSTKINLYATNHHTGQGMLTGYAAKVYNVLIKNDEADESEAIRMMHMIGHWAHTGKIWKTLGYRNAKNAEGFKLARGINLGADLRLRIGTFPAGCARIGIAYTIVRKCFHHVLFPYLFSNEDCKVVVDAGREILNDPIAYHIGAAHFAINPKTIDPSVEMDNAIDRLFIFQKTIFGRSTLSKSVHLSRNLSDLEYYSQTVFDICTAYANDLERIDMVAIKESIGIGVIKHRGLDPAVVSSYFA